MIIGSATMNWSVVHRLVIAWLHDRAQFSHSKLPRVCPICGTVDVMIGVERFRAAIRL
jgi:hypothetical protein